MSDRVLQSLCARGEIEKALHLLTHTVVSPSESTYISLLKACKKKKKKKKKKKENENYNSQASTVHSFAHLKHVCSHLSLDSRVFTFNGLLGDYLVVTLAVCGAVDDALHTFFFSLDSRTVFSWTAIISSYCEYGRSREALMLYKHMCDDNVHPNSHTFVSLFKSCERLHELELGKQLHSFACQEGIDCNAFVEFSILNMYAECGALEDANMLFGWMPNLTLLSWNTMLSSFVTHGQQEKAIQLYMQMEGNDGVEPNHHTFVILFKGCSRMSSLEYGEKMHGYARMKGFTSDPVVGSALISMYGNFREIVKAEDVFGALTEHDVASWNGMISTYIKGGHSEKALCLYMQMRKEGVNPSQWTFLHVVQACAGYANQEVSFVGGHSAVLIAFEIARALHVDALRMGFLSDPFFSSALMSVYGKCGAIVESEQVCSMLSQPDIVSWNAMLSAYVECGQAHKALCLFTQILKEGRNPDPQTFVIVLHALMLATEDSSFPARQHSMDLCLEIGQALHIDADVKGFAIDAFVGSTLLRMYGRLNAIAEAENAFVRLSMRTLVSWNAMLSVYVECNQGIYALFLYLQMQEEQVYPDQLTFTIVIRACSSIVDKEEDFHVDGLSTKAIIALEIGKALHSNAKRNKFMDDVPLINTLLCMYSKCGAIVEARHLFDLLSDQRTVVSWNTMMLAYINNGQGENALLLYARMQKELLNAVPLTMAFALQACVKIAEKETCVIEGRSAKLVALDIGRALHAECQHQWLSSEMSISSTLVRMYGKCGAIKQAEEMFISASASSDYDKRMHSKYDGFDSTSENFHELGKTIFEVDHYDGAIWNAMLSAYSEQGQGEKAIKLYGRMQKEQIPLYLNSVISLLKSCSSAGSLETCTQLHFHIVSAGCDQISSVIATVIHAYGSCSCMEEAEACLSNLPKPDIVSWNASISGYAGEGNYLANVSMFETLIQAGFKPTESTFSSVLSVCSQTGLVTSGFYCFESMLRLFGISPESKHYGSLVDLLGRAGDFKRIRMLLEQTHIQVDVITWLSLLGACQTHGNLALAKWVYDYVIKLHPDQANAYVLMSNMYI